MTVNRARSLRLSLVTTVTVPGKFVPTFINLLIKYYELFLQVKFLENDGDAEEAILLLRCAEWTCVNLFIHVIQLDTELHHKNKKERALSLFSVFCLILYVVSV